MEHHFVSDILSTHKAHKVFPSRKDEVFFCIVSDNFMLHSKLHSQGKS